MKTKIEIKNSFHKTTARLWADLNQQTFTNGDDDIQLLSGHISREQYLRANRKLCGMSDCRCAVFSKTEKLHGLAVELSSEDVYGNIQPVF